MLTEIAHLRLTFSVPPPKSHIISNVCAYIISIISQINLLKETVSLNTSKHTEKDSILGQSSKEHVYGKPSKVL